MQELYADVIVDITAEKLDRVFQYRVPETLRENLEPGMVVEVPFGTGNRMIRGYVTALGSTLAWDPSRVKEIARVITDELGTMDRLVRLAAWMRERCGCTMIQALRTVIPVRKKVRAKENKVILLKADREIAEAALLQMEQKHQSARARLVRALLSEPALPGSLACEKLNITSSVLKALETQGLIEVTSEKVYRNPLQKLKRDQIIVELNEEQQKAADQVISNWDPDTGNGKYLLYGVTGSGKTEVYMELIAEAIRRGEQAIMLIPEIALTYQTVLRFYRRFGDRVSLINSRLSAGERYDQFQRAAAGEIDVMIGPRSALFTPFPKLGIIVIDEEHEPAYVSESTPRYNSREVAFARASIEGARVVMGSATPSLEAYYGTQTGEIRLLSLTRRAKAAALPEVEIVDLREELRNGNRSMLSTLLQVKLTEVLARGEQAMLFLNRRGLAGFISCRSCGHVVKCPHCDVSLSLHRGGRYVCHYCGYEEQERSTCPICGSRAFRTFKAGTEQVEEEIRRMCPEAKVLRMDRDTTKEKDSHTAILSAFSGHEADILKFTKNIVKGHDFPDVTLVGILAADMSLFAPDFRSAERTFQLLTQAAGRAGRAEKSGSVVIQTYDPDNYSIRAAASQDYAAFYEEELSYRSLAQYPPVGSMTAIHLAVDDEQLLETACGYLGKFANHIAAHYRVSVLGPVNEPVAKVQDIYRKVMYLKGEQPAAVRQMRDKLLEYIEINSGFKRLSIQVEAE